MPTWSAFVPLCPAPSAWCCSPPRSPSSSDASQPVPTSGRAHDLAVAKDWVSKGLGQVSADLTLPGDAPLPTLAEQVASWLDWPRVR